MRRWEAIFSEQDREVVRKAGFGTRQEFGQRPALLIIDVNRAFIGSEPRPVLEALGGIEHQLRRFRLGGGRAPHKTDRRMSWPASPHFFHDSRYRDRPNLRRAHKSCRYIRSGAARDCRCDKVRLPTEVIIRKTKASGFFGTPLLTCLRNLGIDCLLVGGVSTSGCVRATVIDAFSYNFSVFVVEECTFDRFELSHLVNLWDMHAKYADVITLKEAVAAINDMP